MLNLLCTRLTNWLQMLSKFICSSGDFENISEICKSDDAAQATTLLFGRCYEAVDAVLSPCHSVRDRGTGCSPLAGG